MRTNRNRIVSAGGVILRYPLKEHDRIDLADHAGRQQRAHDAGLPVPAVLEVHTDHPRPYMVMAKVPGIPLMLADLTDTEAARFAEQVLDFMQAMWEVEGWPDSDPAWPVIWSVLARVAPDPLLDRAAAEAAAAPLRLTHGDLSPGNLMVGEGGLLTGVIDWDAALVSDPAMDWSALLANTPPAVSSRLRSLPASDELERRASVYIDTWGIQHDLWLAGEHPWLLGDRALSEPRL